MVLLDWEHPTSAMAAEWDQVQEWDQEASSTILLLWPSIKIDGKLDVTALEREFEKNTIGVTWNHTVQNFVFLK